MQDKLLIRKLKNGDSDALRKVYEKYKDNLRTIAGSLLNDTYTAEDVLHDVFVSFAENIGHLHIKVSLKSYLTTCVVNKVRDKFRDKQFQANALERIGPIDSNLSRPDKAAITRESSQLLINALAMIPLEQREVIMLRLNAGMKFREIAGLQETSLATVHGRYKYGLKKLRSVLDGEAVE